MEENGYDYVRRNVIDAGGSEKDVMNVDKDRRKGVGEERMPLCGLRGRYDIATNKDIISTAEPPRIGQ